MPITVIIEMYFPIIISDIFLVKLMDNAVFLALGHGFLLRYTRNERFENIFLL